jgi:pimeloyl-ACP methyl ester carboxylesterase
VVKDALAAKLSGRIRLTLIGVLLMLGALGPAASAAMAEANFLGTWVPSPGQTWTITSQSGGSCEGTSALGAGWTFSECHVSGNNYEFTVAEPSIDYSSHNHGTIEGNKLTGEFNDTFGNNVPYTAIREGAATTVAGKVLDRRGKPAEGVKIDLSGTSDGSETVAKSTTTSAQGLYSFEVPAGTYSVTASGEPQHQRGGSLAVTEGKGGVLCSGKAKEATCNLEHLATGEEGHASFTYTACSSPDRMVKGEEVTGCPIIFIPGILGSRVFCGSKELFLNAPVPFSEMQLQSDGKTNKPGACNSAAGVPEGEAGVLTKPYGKDAYGGMLEFLTKIATNGSYAYPYDWRKSVPEASAGLGALVEKVLAETGATHVVLAAHSMGGLVLQNYISKEANALKVVRAVTIGTPYWGAPKSIISLMSGYANAFSLEILDALFGGTDHVQEAVRNYTGLFWLYPSAAFGPWLEIDGAGFPASPVGGTGIDKWVESLGGTTALLDSAEAGHATSDSFTPNGVNYQIMVGIGVPTISKMQITLNEFEPEQIVHATYETGDGTVPARSQTEGSYPADKASSGVPIHYVCNIEHSKEPGNTGIQGRIEDFLLAGEAIKEPPTPETCAFSGTEIQVHQTPIVKHGKPPSLNNAVIDSAGPAPAGAPMTLAQAIAQELVQVQAIGNETTITTDGHDPVNLSLEGQGLTLSVRSIGPKEGSPVYYGPLTGTITVGPSGIVMQGRKKLRPGKRSGAPHVLARVARHGRRYLLRLSASGHGVAAIYTRLGKAPSRRYTRPLLLSAAQLKQLRFAGVSAFGVWERPQRAHVPH